jgi:hypothetical protein
VSRHLLDLPEHVLDTMVTIVESAIATRLPIVQPTQIRSPKNQAMQKYFTFFQKTWAKIGLNGACNSGGKARTLQSKGR